MTDIMGSSTLSQIYRSGGIDCIRFPLRCHKSLCRSHGSVCSNRCKSWSLRHRRKISPAGNRDPCVVGGTGVLADIGRVARRSPLRAASYVFYVRWTGDKVPCAGIVFSVNRHRSWSAATFISEESSASQNTRECARQSTCTRVQLRDFKESRFICGTRLFRI